ncbi:unnamed protein product [Sympodiomycopsis kandeliae]
MSSARTLLRQAPISIGRLPSSTRQLSRFATRSLASSSSTHLAKPQAIQSRLSFPQPSQKRHICSSLCRHNEASAGSEQKGTPIGQIEQRLQLTFTCTVENCGHRSTHEFAKRSYEKGIVLVQCPGCKNRHLIADHLQWFTEHPDEPKTVEQMVAEKGGRVRTGRRMADVEGEEGDQGETIEILSDSEADLLEQNVADQQQAESNGSPKS